MIGASDNNLECLTRIEEISREKGEYSKSFSKTKVFKLQVCKVL